MYVKGQRENTWSFCLFVCLEFIFPLENFLLIWRRHHYRWKPANFDLCSALMAIEQWGFFNVPHLLRHGPTVYNGHPEDPWHSYLLPSVWQWSCHYLFLTTWVCRDRGSNPDLSHARRTLYLYTAAFDIAGFQQNFFDRLFIRFVLRVVEADQAFEQHPN